MKLGFQLSSKKALWVTTACFTWIKHVIIIITSISPRQPSKSSQHWLYYTSLDWYGCKLELDWCNDTHNHQAVILVCINEGLSRFAPWVHCKFNTERDGKKERVCKRMSDRSDWKLIPVTTYSMKQQGVCICECLLCLQPSTKTSPEMKPEEWLGSAGCHCSFPGIKKGD